MAILIIYTGGTIGMKTNPETGALAPFDFNQIETEMPELKRFGIRIDTFTFDPIVDSSNISPKEWIGMARIIVDNYDKYDGFVVLHGTDSMSYSASALSFILQNLDKPVVFTGSQIPIGVLRTDGKENLITAVEIAAAKRGGRSVVPEVSIYFQDCLYRANRTTKHSAEHLNAFRSHNYPPLAWAAIDIKYNYDSIQKIDFTTPTISMVDSMCENVVVLRLFPGINHSTVKAILNIKGLQGVVLECFGSGNAPEQEWLIAEFEGAIARGILLVNVSQCKEGSVNMELYDTGRRLKSIGVVSGGNITVESALVKMMYLLGLSLPYHILQEMMTRSLRGELTSLAIK